jgi:hypothetical protein
MKLKKGLHLLDLEQRFQHSHGLKNISMVLKMPLWIKWWSNDHLITKFLIPMLFENTRFINQLCCQFLVCCTMWIGVEKTRIQNIFHQWRYKHLINHPDNKRFFFVLSNKNSDPICTEYKEGVTRAQMFKCVRCSTPLQPANFTLWIVVVVIR